MIHTTRGCPFRVHVLHEGAAYYNIVEQADALARGRAGLYRQPRPRSARSFISDANFGMFKPDIEKARIPRALPGAVRLPQVHPRLDRQELEGTSRSRSPSAQWRAQHGRVAAVHRSRGAGQRRAFKHLLGQAERRRAAGQQGRHRNLQRADPRPARRQCRCASPVAARHGRGEFRQYPHVSADHAAADQAEHARHAAQVRNGLQASHHAAFLWPLFAGRT